MKLKDWLNLIPTEGAPFKTVVAIANYSLLI